MFPHIIKERINAGPARRMFDLAVNQYNALSERQCSTLFDMHLDFAHSLYNPDRLNAQYDLKAFMAYLASKLKEHDSGSSRIIVMPAGGFAQEIANHLLRAGLSIVGFMDNFSACETLNGIPVFKPQSFNEIGHDHILVATPSLIVQDGLCTQLRNLGADREISFVGAHAFSYLFEQEMKQYPAKLTDSQDRIRQITKEWPAKSVVMAPRLSATVLMALLRLAIEGKPMLVFSKTQSNVDLQITMEEAEKRNLKIRFVFFDSLIEFINVGSTPGIDTIYIPKADFNSDFLDIARTSCPQKKICPLPYDTEVPFAGSTQQPSIPESYKPPRYWSEQIRRLRNENPGRPVVLFTGSALWHNHIKIMRALKEENISVVLFLQGDRFCNAIPIKDVVDHTFCDLLICSGQYATDLTELVALAEVDIVHALCHVCADPALPDLLSQRSKKIIVEYTDFLEIMYAPDKTGHQDMALTLSGATPTSDFNEIWKTLFCCNDGIIFKESPALIDHLKRKYDHCPPALEFHSYIVENLAPDDNIGRPVDYKNIPAPSIAYVGSVNNSPSHPSYSHDSSLLTVARKLTSQKIYFAVFNGVDSGTRTGFEEYVELAEDNPYFDYYPSVSHDNLHRYLKKFSLAFQVLDYRNAPYNPLFLQTTFATRLFNYLEARLPIIMSCRLEHMAEIVRRNDIGVVIDFSELDSLGELVRTTDWERKRRNIDKLVRRLSMKDHIHRLLHFYNQARGDRLFPAKDMPPSATGHAW